jgi:flagellar biosynthetic protein FliR
VGEILIGIFLALLVRILFISLEVAGSAIVFQIGLSSATIFNPMISEQTSAISTFLGLIALVIMMQTDMHHMLLRGMVDSYGLFLPGQGIAMGDASESIVRVVSQAFRIGIQMTGPFFIVMMMINVALGLLARLMPQLQVFFLAQPVQIIVGFILLMITLVSIMYLFVDTIGTAIQGMMSPGVP